MTRRSDDWQRRHQVIRDILVTKVVANQGELGHLLHRRGFRVTQSSVSRDLRELGAIKLDGRYVLRDALVDGTRRPLPHQQLLVDLAHAVVAVRSAGPFQIVMQTRPGLASAVAQAIDSAGWQEVIGCLAGDDTIFLATVGKRHQTAVVARLARLVKEAQRG